VRLDLDLCELLEVKSYRESLNSDFRARDSDLRVIHLSPQQREEFDSHPSDLSLEIDDDGNISPRALR
jgi:hypothetical protein